MQSHHNIVASVDTWLKRRPEQSFNLRDDEKELCTAGLEIPVDSYAQVTGGHWQIKTHGETFYIFDVGTHGIDSHWNCSWEQDGDDNDRHVYDAEVSRAASAQGRSVSQLNVNSSFDDLITPHFTYGEICRYEDARRFVEQYQLDAAKKLCLFLEKVRAHFGGKQVIITSGHRPQRINRAVGGADYSEHLYRAPGIGGIDFYVDGISTYDVQAYCEANWGESIGRGAEKDFVHVGCGRGLVIWDY